MKYRTHNLLKSRKAQFFILSVFVIVSILYFLSRWLEPSTLIDTSSVVLMEEPFIFNNIKEKVVDVVFLSKECDELKFNLDEYREAVEDYLLSKNCLLDFNYTYPTCVRGITINFTMELTSTKMQLASNFSLTWMNYSNGHVCSSAIECNSGYCVEGVCCNSDCTGSICQTCGIYSSAGAGTCGYVNSNLQDPHNDCGTTSCYNGNCKGDSYVCGYYATGDGNCPTCQTCVGASSGSCVNYAAYSEDTGCTAQCKGCSGGACVNIPAGTADSWGASTCTATHYRCNGAASCTAPCDGITNVNINCNTYDTGAQTCASAGMCGCDSISSNCGTSPWTAWCTYYPTGPDGDPISWSWLCAQYLISCTSGDVVANCYTYLYP